MLVLLFSSWLGHSNLQWYHNSMVVQLNVVSLLYYDLYHAVISLHCNSSITLSTKQLVQETVYKNRPKMPHLLKQATVFLFLPVTRSLSCFSHPLSWTFQNHAVCCGLQTKMANPVKTNIKNDETNTQIKDALVRANISHFRYVWKKKKLTKNFVLFVSHT